MVNSQCFKIEITYLRGIRIRCRRIFIHKQWSKHRYPGTRGTILLLRHHFAGRELQQISSYHFTFNLWPRWYTLHSKKNSIRGRKKERFDVENIFLFSYDYSSVYSIRYFTRAVFFFFFSSFFSRLLLFPFYDGIRIVLVIIIAYFDCQCIIITITITTIIALRHVYLDEQNKDNFSRMAVTINDETCDKITMRGDYTVKMYRRSQDRRQYATSLLLSRNIYLSELQARNNFSLFARTTMIRGAMRHGDNVDAASWRKTKERLFFNVHALYTKHYKDK